MRHLLLAIPGSIAVAVLAICGAQAAKIHNDHTPPVITYAPVHADHTPPVKTDAPVSPGGAGQPASGWHHRRPPPQQPIPCLGNLC